MLNTKNLKKLKKNQFQILIFLILIQICHFLLKYR